MADAKPIISPDARLPAFLLDAHKADYPHLAPVHRQRLLSRVAQELDPSTSDIDYSREDTDMAHDIYRPRRSAPSQDSPREADDLVADLSTHVATLRREAERPKLEQLAGLLDSLTYGEMMEFAQGCLKVPDYKPPGNEYDWASIMHRWCTGRIA